MIFGSTTKFFIKAEIYETDINIYINCDSITSLKKEWKPLYCRQIYYRTLSCFQQMSIVRSTQNLVGLIKNLHLTVEFWVSLEALIIFKTLFRNDKNKSIIGFYKKVLILYRLWDIKLFKFGKFCPITIFMMVRTVGDNLRKFWF